MSSQNDTPSHDHQADGAAAWHALIGSSARTTRRHRFEPLQVPRSEQAVSQADGVA